MRCAAVAAITLVLGGALMAQVAVPPYHPLYADHQWFALRDAVAQRGSPALYRGALASAFNRPDEAERLLVQAVRDAVSADEAAEAREMLGTLYMRQGRSVDARRVFEEMRANEPGREDLRSVIALLSAFTGRPPLRVSAARRVRFSATPARAASGSR
jgi:hypothetical protein